jgi:hypothetical protein
MHARRSTSRSPLALDYARRFCSNRLVAMGFSPDGSGSRVWRGPRCVLIRCRRRPLSHGGTPALPCLECLGARDAITLAASFRRDNPSKGVCLLTVSPFRLHDYVATVSESSPPCVCQVVESCCLKICLPQYLEATQRWFCDDDHIMDFLSPFKMLFERDPRLIFSPEETTVRAVKRFRVCAETGKLPLVIAETELPYITGRCAISAAGAEFK